MTVPVDSTPYDEQTMQTIVDLLKDPQAANKFLSTEELEKYKHWQLSIIKARRMALEEAYRVVYDATTLPYQRLIASKE